MEPSWENLIVKPWSRPFRNIFCAIPVVLCALSAPSVSVAHHVLFGAPPEAGETFSGGIAEGFMRQMQRCWPAGALPLSAQNTTVVIALDMSREALPIEDSIRMIRFFGGSVDDAELVFTTAKRALIRCAGAGYDLPRDQFAAWQHLQVTILPPVTQPFEPL